MKTENSSMLPHVAVGKNKEVRDIWMIAKNLDFDRNLPCPIVKNHDFLTWSRRKNLTTNPKVLKSFLNDKGDQNIKSQEALGDKN